MTKKFTLSAKPVLSRMLSKITPTDIFVKASDIVELSPATTRYSPGAICLKGELSRAISTEHSTLDEMAKLVPEGNFRHGATKAYLFENALIADGSTYCGTCYSNESRLTRRPLLAGMHNSYETLQLSSSMGTEMYFGHWLLDGTCKEIIAQDRGMGSVIHKRPLGTHEAAYRSLLGLNPVEERVAHIEKLWVVDDRGNNDYKLSRFSRILDRIEKFSGARSDKCEHIFLARRGGTSRWLSNEPVVVEHLDKYGFQFVDPTNKSPVELVKLFSTARIVVSVEGSHQSHAILSMPSGGAVITIQPPSRVNLQAYRDFCDFKKVRQAFIVGEPQREGFAVDPQRLLKLIDLTIFTLDRNTAWS